MEKAWNNLSQSPEVGKIHPEFEKVKIPLVSQNL